MFEDADNFADLFRGGFSVLLVTIPFLVILSSSPVLASNEFTIERMAQYDVHGVPYGWWIESFWVIWNFLSKISIFFNKKKSGCRGSSINLEAKSLQTWTTSRHCVITRWSETHLRRQSVNKLMKFLWNRFQDLTVDQFREIRAKAGGVIILLPENMSSLSSEEKQVIGLHILYANNVSVTICLIQLQNWNHKNVAQQIYVLEQAIMAQEISIPVYFSKYDPDLNNIIDEISTSKEKQETSKNNKRESAISEIINSISANGYQVCVGIRRNNFVESLNEIYTVRWLYRELAMWSTNNPKFPSYKVN